MDTLTHALSGALLARATAPSEARIPLGARVGAGFLACAFPDIDAALSTISPITYLTQHRGVTHSIFLLPVWAFGLSWLFSRIDRGKQIGWRDYFSVCLLALGAHIVGDLITSFGTMIYAPFSDARVAWGMTFIIDLWFSGIIVAALLAASIWRRSRVPAVLGLALLASYVGLQALQHERAIEFGERYAASQGFAGAEVSAIPRPVSPFNWMVMVTEGERYHYANVNLVRATPAEAAGADASFITRLDAGYAPLSEAKWTAVHKYGPQPSERELAANVLAHAKLGFFRWFADYPVLYRIDRDNPSTCVWFEDLRFVMPGRDSALFRYGLCGEHYDWHVFRLLEDGAADPVD